MRKFLPALLITSVNVYADHHAKASDNFSLSYVTENINSCLYGPFIEIAKKFHLNGGVKLDLAAKFENIQVTSLQFLQLYKTLIIMNKLEINTIN